jgi:hypothetical protein
MKRMCTRMYRYNLACALARQRVSYIRECTHESFTHIYAPNYCRMRQHTNIFLNNFRMHMEENARMFKK